MKHITHSTPLTTPEEILELVSHLKKCSSIAWDTEFLKERTFFPQFELLQIGTHEQSWLIDIQAFPKSRIEAIRPLLTILQDPGILKIGHALHGDQECLYTHFGVFASPSLDTAIAASLLGFGDSLSLSDLIFTTLNVRLKKGHSRSHWERRPLPQELLDYAGADVEYLTRAGQKLLELLEQKNRKEWALKLSAKMQESSLFDPAPLDMALKMINGHKTDRHTYHALLALVRWREEEVRNLNIPRRWVADDRLLMDLAKVRPKTMEQLGAFRGLSPGELKKWGKDLLKALSAPPPEGIPEPNAAPERLHHPKAEENRSVSLLHCYIHQLADQNEISAKVLLTSHEALKLTRLLTLPAGSPVTPEQLIEEGIMGPEAVRLIGEDLIAFISGKRALTIEGSKVKMIQVK